jgi:hypothetical protein
MARGKLNGLHGGSGDWHEDIAKFVGEKSAEYPPKVCSCTLYVDCNYGMHLNPPWQYVVPLAEHLWMDSAGSKKDQGIDFKASNSNC